MIKEHTSGTQRKYNQINNVFMKLPRNFYILPLRQNILYFKTTVLLGLCLTWHKQL